MLCPSCNGFRPANNMLCPFCNAPSPLSNEARNGQNASFSNEQSQTDSMSAFLGVVPNDRNGTSRPQIAFPAQGQQPFAQPADGDDNSFWSQKRATRGTEKQQSMGLTPYQDLPNANEQALVLLPNSFPTLAPGIQQVNPLVPALPNSDQAAPVYVPPAYTKQRPIIPRYRAISGLISIIIVCSLLCGGAGYYAQVTGKLTGLEKLIGLYTPPSVPSPTQHILPVPSSQVVYTANPAATIIDSVGISTSVNHGIIPRMVNKFTAGQSIWLVCSANIAKQSGVITVKWYTNNQLYKSSSSDSLTANQLITATFNEIYNVAAEGKAEIYWNNELAATVLFVVEPAV